MLKYFMMHLFCFFLFQSNKKLMMLYSAQDDHWVARLGALRRGSNLLSPHEQVRVISHIFIHPGYIDTGFVNDISILRMEEPVRFTDYIRPVCLPPPTTDIRDGRLCTVVGWGQLYETGRVFRKHPPTTVFFPLSLNSNRLEYCWHPSFILN